MYKLFEFSSKNINFEDMENYILEISLWYVYLNMKQRDMKFFFKMSEYDCKQFIFTSELFYRLIENRKMSK